jgi:peptide/nickel transport system substrate-binding protein
VADLNKQANSEFDPAKRIDLADQMSEAMLSDYTIIPFYATPNVYAVKKGLANYGASQFETIDWTKVGWTA